jgi:basic amino acid/polyamine antiporter, APA family
MASLKEQLVRRKPVRAMTEETGADTGELPVSGSSYSYAYATLGEGVAIVVAACLLLEYGVASAAVAVGWSQYLNEFLDNVFGWTIPDSISNAPEQDGVFNLPAVVLILLCTLLISESAKVNTVMVIIK